MVETVSSLADNVRPIEAGAHVTAAVFLGATPVLALGDGSALIVGAQDERRVSVHEDSAILVAVAAGEKLVTGGGDGRVYSLDAQGQREELADEKGKWIDAIAGRDDFSIAWSTGRQVRARDPKGIVKNFTAPSSVRGLAFAPKGYRLAIAHYNGASLWFPNIASPVETFEWKGAHLDISFFARWAICGDLDAGEFAARLAAFRQARHADERLSGQDAIPLLVGRWPLARDLGRRILRRLAVQGQGRADGQGAARMRRAPGESFARRLPSQGLGAGDRL